MVKSKGSDVRLPGFRSHSTTCLAWGKPSLGIFQNPSAYELFILEKALWKGCVESKKGEKK